jgi:hypothetical protein
MTSKVKTRTDSGSRSRNTKDTRQPRARARKSEARSQKSETLRILDSGSVSSLGFRNSDFLQLVLLVVLAVSFGFRDMMSQVARSGVATERAVGRQLLAERCEPSAVSR